MAGALIAGLVTLWVLILVFALALCNAAASSAKGERRQMADRRQAKAARWKGRERRHAHGRRVLPY
jgi:hypothetical protein